MSAPMEGPPNDSSGFAAAARWARPGFSVGGIGIGAVLISVANTVGPENVVGTILLYLVPVAAVAFDTAFEFLNANITRYLQLRLARNVRRSLATQLDDPATSGRHKMLIRKKLEEFDLLLITEEVNRVSQIGKRAARSNSTGVTRS
jgi:hypothetical protein